MSVRQRRLESPRARAEARRVAAAVSWAEREIELTDDEVAGALGGISTRTVARYRLVLAKALDAVFGNDKDRMQAWLHEPLPAFRGRTPLRTIVQGDAAKVVTLLANIDAGVFD